jgi:septal ring factor EnvC (AmiA/AmiB activator)
MIEKIIRDIEAKVNAEKISDAGRQEILQSLAKLKTEVAALKHPVQELRSSVQGFEQSHPKLVETINNLSARLANLGV